MKYAVILAALFVSTVVFAQPQTKTPSQVAVDITGEVGLLARYAEQQQTLVQQLQAENAELKKKLEDKEKGRPVTGDPSPNRHP
jgi:ABC-type Fe3+-hydroxamate transport system substrate-binding protein